MKYRTENNSTKEFKLSNKVAFSSSTVKDSNIQKGFAKLAKLDATGRLWVIPASASVEDLTNSLAILPGQEKSKECLAAQKEGRLVYHAIPTYMRVFESTGESRDGASEAEFEGFGDTPVGDVIPA